MTEPTKHQHNLSYNYYHRNRNHGKVNKPIMFRSPVFPNLIKAEDLMKSNLYSSLLDSIDLIHISPVTVSITNSCIQHSLSSPSLSSSSIVTNTDVKSLSSSSAYSGSNDNNISINSDANNGNDDTNNGNNNNICDDSGNGDNCDVTIIDLPIPSGVGVAVMSDYLNWCSSRMNPEVIKQCLRATSLLDDLKYLKYLKYCVQRLLLNYQTCKDVLDEIHSVLREQVYLLMPKDLLSELYMVSDKFMTLWLKPYYY
jgi:hypothetical protein